MMTSEQKQDMREHWLPLTAVIALVALAVTVAVQGQRMISRLENVERAVRQSWTLTDMEIWTLNLSRSNPAIFVPTAGRERGETGDAGTTEEKR